MAYNNNRMYYFADREAAVMSGKKTYTKPAVIFEKKIEAFAATCIGNPLSKTAPGAPNSFGRVCESGYIFS
jgi:hypothetical protein